MKQVKDSSDQIILNRIQHYSRWNAPQNKAEVAMQSGCISPVIGYPIVWTTSYLNNELFGRLGYVLILSLFIYQFRQSIG